MEFIPHVIDGQERESASGERFTTVDPWPGGCGQPGPGQPGTRRQGRRHPGLTLWSPIVLLTGREQATRTGRWLGHMDVADQGFQCSA